MTSENVFFLEGYIDDLNSDRILINVETYVSVFALLSCGNNSIKLCFVNLGNPLFLSIPRKSLNAACVQFVAKEFYMQEELYCSLPLVKLSSLNTVVGGLCAVLRWAINDLVGRIPNHPSKSLLGFRNGCLLSCAESSTWTKLCELEFPETVKNVIKTHMQGVTHSYEPECLLKLESHLKVPVRTHNISKRTQDLVKKVKQNTENKVSLAGKDVSVNAYPLCGKKSVKEMCEELNKLKLTEKFELNHCYLEGIDLTLTDIVVLPCVHLLFEYLPASGIKNIPLVKQWYQNVLCVSYVEEASRAFEWNELKTDLCCGLSEDSYNSVGPISNEGSLYSRDSNHLKVKCRNLDPTPIISLLKENSVIPVYKENNLPQLNWDQLPSVLHPSNGELPKRRIQRKCQQLENMVSAVCKIAVPGQIIVDFCSGGGHVGLLLAYFLPHCEILLVENKEESLLRARKRVSALELQNIKLFQCNLDYFNASFDIGVSLHACGVATDLVIQKCISKNAAFVCCPCCYGAIDETSNLKYPRSKTYQNLLITYKDFILLAHCADRTETNSAKVKQGIYCMGLVDTDRLLHAGECGYATELTKMKPETCSPKHNLLIGKYDAVKEIS